MSTRDSLIKSGNGIILLSVAVIAIFWWMNKDSMPVIYLIGIVPAVILAVIGFILLMNKYIYNKGTSLGSVKNNVQELSFNVNSTYKQVVIDIVWELKVSFMNAEETSYTVVITYPDGSVHSQDLVAGNVTTPLTATYETQVNVYRKKGEQHIIENPKTGNYSVKIDVKEPYASFNIKEITATAWN